MIGLAAVSFFPTPDNSPIIRYQLGILQFDSILTLTGVSVRLHRLRVQSHKTVVASDTSFKCQVPRLPILLSDLPLKLGVPITTLKGLITC